MIVLIAVMEKQVAITDAFNPNAIKGRQSIFVTAPTEMKASVEIVGVYSTLETAIRARTHHAAAHPGRRYVQKVATLDDNDKWSQSLEPPRCIKCGVLIGPIGSFCPACQRLHFAECNGNDPRAGEGDPTPLVKVRSGGPNVIAYDGTGAIMNTGA